MNELTKIRRQLKKAIKFMESTPGRYPLYWCGDMPAYPNEFEPDDWGMSNWPIEKVWDEYLACLRDEGLADYYEKARKLNIRELLEASPIGGWSDTT